MDYIYLECVLCISLFGNLVNKSEDCKKVTFDSVVPFSTTVSTVITVTIILSNTTSKSTTVNGYSFKGPFFTKVLQPTDRHTDIETKIYF